MQEANRVAVTATTTGTGSFTLSSAILGHQTFGTALGTGGNTEVHYGIVHDVSGTWEVGIGTYLGGTNQLQRDLVLDGSSGSSKVSFAAGNKTVYIPRVAEATMTARSRRAADVALELRAAAAQSANLLTVYNASGTASAAVNAQGGISLGTAVAASATDTTRHITLYSTTYGFNVTAQNLNYVNANGSGFHSFYVGGAKALSVGSGTTEVSSNHTVQTTGYTQSVAGYVGFSLGTSNGSLNIKTDGASNSATTAYGLFYGTTATFRVARSGAVSNSTGTITVISDAATKTNVADATPKLAELNKLRVVNYKSKVAPWAGKLLGFVADEAEKVFPGLVEADDETGQKSFKWSVLVPMLVKAVQELTGRDDALEKRIVALEAMLKKGDANGA